MVRLGPAAGAPPAAAEPAGAVDEAAARRAALRLLAKGGRTAAEVRRALARRFPAAAVESALAALIRAGLLDDRRTARDWLEYRAERRPSGAVRMLADLARRGLDPELARACVAEHYRRRGGDERAELRRAVSQISRGADVDPAARGRLSRRLVRRGFAPEDVEAELAARLGAADEGRE